MSLQNILDGVSRLDGYRRLFYEGFLADCDIEDSKDLFAIIDESVAIISDLLEVAKCASHLLKARDQYEFDELQRAMEKLDGLDERSNFMHGRDGPAKARAILFGDNLISSRSKPYSLTNGGSRFSVLLNADETDALAAIQAKTGESKAAVVKRLILAASASSISETI